MNNLRIPIHLQPPRDSLCCVRDCGQLAIRVRDLNEFGERQDLRPVCQEHEHADLVGFVDGTVIVQPTLPDNPVPDLIDRYRDTLEQIALSISPAEHARLEQVAADLRRQWVELYGGDARELHDAAAGGYGL